MSLVRTAGRHWVEGKRRALGVDLVDLPLRHADWKAEAVWQAKLDSTYPAQHARCTWRPVLCDLAANASARCKQQGSRGPWGAWTLRNHPELNGRQLGLDPCLGLIRGPIEERRGLTCRNDDGRTWTFLDTFCCWSGPEQDLMLPSLASLNSLDDGPEQPQRRRVFCVQPSPATARSAATTMDCRQQRCDFHS